MFSKKIKKNKDPNLYNEQQKNDYIFKRVKKLLKHLKVNLIVKGFENLPKPPAVIVANHSSVMDAVLIIKALGNDNMNSLNSNYQFVFLAKKELQKNKKIRSYTDIVSTFYIDRNNPRQTLEQINEIILFARKHKKFVVIFPEGTRSLDGNMNKFKPGVFKIIKKGFFPTIPTTINNSRSILNFKRKNKIQAEVIFHKYIKPISLISNNTTTISENIFKIIQKQLKPVKTKKNLKEFKIF